MKHPHYRLGLISSALSAVLVSCALNAIETKSEESIPRPTFKAVNPILMPPVGWYAYRGNPSLTGFTKDALPEKPVLLWIFKTGGDIRSSPAVVGNQLYIGSGDHSIYTLNAATGEKLWSYATEGEVESSPLFFQNMVIAGSADGNVYALNSEKGILVWKFKTGDKILGAPNLFYQPKGNTSTSQQPAFILVGSYDKRIYALEPLKGEMLWNFETENFINGSPALTSDMSPKPDGSVKDVFTAFGGCDGMLHIVNVRDGQEARSVLVEQPIAGSPALEGKFAYFGHYGNEFVCADMDAGKIVWRYKDLEFPFFSSPAIGPEQVVFGGRDKRIHCVDKTTGKKIWTFETQGRVDFSPVIANDKVLCGSSDGRLYLLSLKEGKELWSYDLAQPLVGSAAVVNGKIYVGCEDGGVYCFGQK